jgi:uncharacterized membrane protein
VDLSQDLSIDGSTSISRTVRCYRFAGVIPTQPPFLAEISSLALGQQHPAEQGLPASDREAHTRRWGNRLLVGGTTILIAAIIVTLSVATLYGTGAWGCEDGRLFATIALTFIDTLGAILATVGFLERRDRSHRAATRQAIQRQKDTVAQLELLVGLVSALPGRLSALEDRAGTIEKAIEQLPNYGQGVIDGAQMRANVINSQ